MSDTPAPNQQDMPYAMRVANESYNWYKLAAIRSRRNYRTVEIAVLLISAAIPTSTSIVRNSTIIPAILGSIVVVLTGLRAIFHWQENYLRFSSAREAVEAERRLYTTSAPPYDDPQTKDQRLVEAVTRIEQEEMSNWQKVVAKRPKN